MRKMLIIGCGGSGAKTLSYAMDQLKTMLAARLPEEYERPQDVTLPKAWQFLAIDVPLAPESAGKNLPNVYDAGGHYISCGSSSRYHEIDRKVSDELAAAADLGTIASWALTNPDEETTPIAAGAGQYRAIGRMLTLSKLQDIEAELKKHWNVLFSPETERELSSLSAKLGGTDVKDVETQAAPLVFVVSSMSGGAGASMALDVCRLLTGLPGNSVGLNSLFMVTPDVFNQVAKDAVAGANPNALAMFSELIAAQFGAATAEDKRIFEDLGIKVGDDPIPVGRIFPVGAKSGVKGAQLGDGKPGTVYRALGRGIAALMIDSAAMEEFVAFNLGNRGGLQMDQSIFGWGVEDQKNIPWGSYGYAQLSLGRDRYGEYAAQRLARAAVSKLLSGHMDKTSSLSGDAALAELVANNAQRVTEATTKFLPPKNKPVQWIHWRFRRQIEEWAQKQSETLAAQIPGANGQRGRDWLPTVQGAMRVFEESVTRSHPKIFYSAVYDWAGVRNLQEGILTVIRHEVGKYGVPYGIEILRRLRADLDNAVVPELTQAASLWNAPLQLDENIQSELAGMNGKLVDNSEIVRRIVQGVRANLVKRGVGYLSRMVSVVLGDFINNFLSPLESSLHAAHVELEKTAALTQDDSLGTAQVKTNVPNLWPEESNYVPDRFSQAANEVFLTDIDRFPTQFESDILNAAMSTTTDSGLPLDHTQALQTSAARVVAGEWESLSGAQEAPRDLITLVSPWVAKILVRNPQDPSVISDPRPAKFEVKLDAADVLDRARRYISRPGFSFHRFISTSLREYIMDPTLSESEKRARREQFVAKFTQAMKYALPLAQVNQELVSKLYGEPVSYKFNFSTIPLDGDEVTGLLEHEVVQFPNFVPTDITRPLGDALSNQGEERAIDIFGSYPNYAPIVFDSLLTPIREQWSKTSGRRSEFWRARRSRPLPAALPMSEKERRAIIAGWYIGLLTGHVSYPASLDVSDSEPVQIYDEKKKTWFEFESPLLTPPSEFRSVLDWLPNVLESVSIAWSAALSTPQLESLQPYVALRNLYDSGEVPTKDGRVLEGQRLLRTWLFSGERPLGDVRVVPGTGPEATPVERKDAAIAWLRRHKEAITAYIPSKVLDERQLHSGEARPWADVKEREGDYGASELPVFADIARDVSAELSLIILMLEAAYEQGDPALDTSTIPKFGAAPSITPRVTKPGEGDLFA